MKFTLSWLKTHLDTSHTVAALADRLTMLGLEVEEVSDPSCYLEPFIIAEIFTAQRHPEADKLQLCQVTTGSETLEVVCGAPNARPGLKAVFAPIGTWIPGSQITLKKAKIRGVESHGMLCSTEELLLGNDSKGIIELPSDAPVGTRVIDYYPSWADPLFTLAVTPNRADCFGVRSIARDLAASGMGKLKPLTIQPIPGSFKTDLKIHLQFPDGEEKACPYFAGRLIRGVNNNHPSPAWLQERLKSVGIRTISPLVDITNFLTIDRNRPLHVFDADHIDGDLTIRYAQKEENLLALDDQTYQLEPGMVVIADTKNVLSLGGIMGGLNSGCIESTTNIFLEAAYFDPATISRTGRKLNLHSDARHRFERGVDPCSVLDGIEAATDLILKLCGGEVGDVIIAGTPPFTEQTITLRLSRIKQLVGVTIPTEQATDILQKLGCKVTKGNNHTLNIIPPSWRPDLREEIDLIEECIRIHGYQTIPSAPLPKPQSIPKPALSAKQKRDTIIKRHLAQQGYLECVTWSFTDEKLSPYFVDHKDQQKLIPISNPIASQLSIMRPSLLPNLLLAIRDNSHHGIHNFALFEVGPQFINTTDQQASVAVGIRVGQAVSRHWAQQERDVDIFDVKADLWSLIECLGLMPDKLSLQPQGPAWYHPGQVGSLYLGKNLVGHFGRLHPTYAKLFDIENPCTLFECFYEALPMRKSNKHQEWQSYNLQPIERDLAFIVAKSLPVANLVNALQKVDKKLIKAIQVFDIYTGKGIDDDKKSVALNIVIQPQTQTLTDAEIDQLIQKMVAQASKEVQAALRQ